MANRLWATRAEAPAGKSKQTQRLFLVHDHPHVAGQLARVMLASAAIVLLVMGGGAYGHAGHDAIPEAATQVVANLAPRFYASSDTFEGVLVFSEPKQLDAPVLFLARTDDGAAVAQADVRAELITPTARKLEVKAGSANGTYVIVGVDPKTTCSISVEATSAGDTDILAFDNVIVPPPLVEVHSDALIAPAGGTNKAFPVYLKNALLAVLCVLMVANILVVLSWLTGKRKAASTLLLALFLAGADHKARAHAGDEHDAVALTASAVQSGAGARHFLSIDAQFQADLRTTKAVEIQLPHAYRALGEVTIRPDREADVTPPAEGKLLPPLGIEDSIPVAGTTVTKGQMLVVLEQVIPAADRVTLSTEKSQIEADLASAQQEQTVAQREKERAEQLTNVIAGKELDRLRADFRIATDRVAGLQKRLSTLTAALQGTGPNVRQIPITSPITGYIAESHATQGEYVTTAKKLFTIVNLEEVFVQADIFESDIAKVSQATTARITVEAYPRQSFYGTLQSFGQQIDPQKRTLRGQFNVKNPDNLLRGGMFASVEIESKDEAPAIVVPKQAVITENGVRQVYKKISPELFVALPVAVAAYRENLAVIAEGLKAGDRVALNGLYQIRMAPIVRGGK